MRETLHKQLENKNWIEFNKKNTKNLENETFKQKQEFDKTLSMEQKYVEKKVKENNRNFILKQMEDDNLKKQRHSVFQYNTQTRHNPITNPI